MGRILLFLLVAAALLLLTWTIAGLPGQMSLEIGEIAIEAPTPVAGLGLIALFLVLYGLVRLAAWLIRLPRSLRARRAARRRTQGDVAVTRTLLALAAGDGAGARRDAAQSRRLLGDTPQTLLLASEAGRLAGRTDETEAALLALAARKDAAFLGLRGLLRDAMARQDWTAAAEFARRAEAAHPGASWLRAERAQLSIRSGAWAEALALTREAAPKAALAAAAAEVERDGSKALRLARQAFEADPSLTPAALAYASRLRAAGHARRADAALRQAWIAAPHPDIADLLLAPITDPLARVQAAKQLISANPAHPESHFQLARASLAAGLTGEARHQVQEAHNSGMNQRRLWTLLADIEERERGDSDEGRAAQRDALRRAAEAMDDPTWHCSACGAPHETWRAACSACGAVGTLRWGTHAATPRLSSGAKPQAGANA